jgi:F-box/leucine-rich repeat protein 7
VASFCLSLRELSISDCVRITDFGLYELAKLGPNLRYLSVAKCERISDSGVIHVARLCYKLRY